MGYPCIRYHATQEPRRCLTEADEKALGRGWYDSPKKAKAAAEKKSTKNEQYDQTEQE